jgi:phosphoenolpyruvate synthase/pyruvate phosphate dikinase
MKNIYSLDSGFAEKNELGNKGANLVVMTQLGLPVPPG